MSQMWFLIFMLLSSVLYIGQYEIRERRILWKN